MSLWVSRGRRLGSAVASMILCAWASTPMLPGSGATPALASTEEFSTFDVAGQEQDDESLLDHTMLRPPHAWRDEWERAHQAIRTSQGCLTAGQWFIDTDLKLSTPLGHQARMGLDYRDSESDEASYQYLDFSFQFPTRWGAPGIMFRPLYDKSRQDFALTWDAGTDTSANLVEVVFVFEDFLNNLWAWRQSRVGNQNEPYLRHPYEPGVRWMSRHDGWRTEVGGRYLTPSLRRVTGDTDPSPPHIATLWGTLGYAAVEVEALGFEWEARGLNKQAKSTDAPLGLDGGSNENFRRLWSAELAVRRALSPRLSAEVHWIYQDRDQDYAPPTGPGRFGGIDHLLMFDGLFQIHPRLFARFGALYDRISIDRTGNVPFSYGSRRESRAFLGLMGRWGRVSMAATEGFELDTEPYQVWGIHDKATIQLQSTF